MQKTTLYIFSIILFTLIPLSLPATGNNEPLYIVNDQVITNKDSLPHSYEIYASGLIDAKDAFEQYGVYTTHDIDTYVTYQYAKQTHEIDLSDKDIEKKILTRKILYNIKTCNIVLRYLLLYLLTLIPGILMIPIAKLFKITQKLCTHIFPITYESDSVRFNATGYIWYYINVGLSLLLFVIIATFFCVLIFQGYDKIPIPIFLFSILSMMILMGMSLWFFWQCFKRKKCYLIIDKYGIHGSCSAPDFPPSYAFYDIDLNWEQIGKVKLEYGHIVGEIIHITGYYYKCLYFYRSEESVIPIGMICLDLYSTHAIIDCLNHFYSHSAKYHSLVSSGSTPSTPSTGLLDYSLVKWLLMTITMIIFLLSNAVLIGGFPRILTILPLLPYIIFIIATTSDKRHKFYALFKNK
ncbi:MAG: hypothetical protein K6A36_03185 [Paludibacteraceae bacterium]|nr:hypothetical protein [Paludibacteraceae bacterium]